MQLNKYLFKKRKIKLRIEWLGYLLLVVLLFLPLIPVFRQQFFPMHDYTHVARLVQLDQAIMDGHFPVRWSKDLGWGYGMPLFNFYAPLPYYFGKVFLLLGFSYLGAVKAVFALTFVLAFAGMFLLAKRFFHGWGGLLAAILFVYSPYRAVDFYVRGALGELMAISLLPWALWGLIKLVDSRKIKDLFLAAVLLSALLLSHTVLAMVGLPFLAVILVAYIFIYRKRKTAYLWLFSALLLGFALALFFVLPAYLEKGFTRVGTLIQGYSNYSHHFLYFRQFLYGNWGYGGSVDGIDDLMSFHLGKVHLFLAALTLVAAVLFGLRSKKDRPLLWLTTMFFLSIAWLAFLSTYRAKLIWDAIPLMAFIQFPWRLNSLIIVLLAFLGGGAIFYARKLVNKETAVLILIVFIFLIVKTNLRYFQPEKYINPEDIYYTDTQKIRQNMSGIIPDYVPIWVKNDPVEVPESEYAIIEGSAQVDLKESKTHILTINTNSEKPAVIQINRFYFPGWKAYLNGQKTDIFYKDNGVMQINLPSGENQLKLILTKTNTQKLSEVVSLTTLLIIVGWWLYDSKKNK
jgi:hypothetical protein